MTPSAMENAKRTRRIIVRVSDDDRARIRANAQSAGLRLSEYVRRVAIEGQIVQVQQSGYGMSLAFQLRRVGVNLNQIAKVANTDGEVPAELTGALRKIETILDRILRTVETE